MEVINPAEQQPAVSPEAAAENRRRKGGKGRKKHSTKALAIRGVLFNWVGRVCSFVITFVATPIILTRLGNEAYGLWAIVMSVGGYYALADIGMQGACTKYIAEFEAKGDRESTHRLFSTALLLYSILAGAVVLISLPVAWCFPFFFELKEQSVSTVRWAVILSGAAVAIRLQSQVFVATIKALKRFDVANVISVSVQILDASLMIWAVSAGYGLMGMACVMAGTTLLSRVIESVSAYRLLGGLPWNRLTIDREMFQRLFRFSSWNVLRQFANRLQNRSAPLIIGSMMGPASVPYFSLANSLITKTHSLTQSVTTVVMPLASHLDAQQRRQDLLRMMIVSARLLITMAMAVAVVLLVFGRSFIDLWLGPGYANHVGPVLKLLAIAFVADSVSGGMRAMLTGIDRVDFVTKLNWTSALVTVLLGVILVWQFGVLGMAWALLISSVVVNVFICPYLTCRLYEYSWLRYLSEVLVRPVLAMVPGLLLALLLIRRFHPTRMLEWLPQAGATAAMIGVAAFWICLDPSLRAECFRSIGIRWPNSFGREPVAPDVASQ